MSGPGMWMPKQKHGINWVVTFSITVISTGEKIVNRTRGFRIKQNALDWIKSVKADTLETARVKPEYILFSGFTYTQPKKTADYDSFGDKAEQ